MSFAEQLNAALEEILAEQRAMHERVSRALRETGSAARDRDEARKIASGRGASIR